MMGNGIGFGIPGLGMVIFWGLIIFLAILIVRGFSGGTQSQNEKGALDILNERFARGEIDRAEYEAKRKVIN